MSTIWSSAVAGDEVSVDLHLTEQDAFNSIRDAWGVPDHVTDEAMANYLTLEYQVDIAIQEHPLPREATPPARKPQTCGNPQCLCNPDRWNRKD